MLEHALKTLFQHLFDSSNYLKQKLLHLSVYVQVSWSWSPYI